MAPSQVMHFLTPHTSKDPLIGKYPPSENGVNLVYLTVMQIEAGRGALD